MRDAGHAPRLGTPHDGREGRVDRLHSVVHLYGDRVAVALRHHSVRQSPRVVSVPDSQPVSDAGQCARPQPRHPRRLPIGRPRLPPWAIPPRVTGLRRHVRNGDDDDHDGGTRRCIVIIVAAHRLVVAVPWNAQAASSQATSATTLVEGTSFSTAPSPSSTSSPYFRI